MSESGGNRPIPQKTLGSAGPLPLFEMRRMEALSNTICGVAMTLLAYQIPKEPFDTNNPTWGDILHAYGAHLSALMLSFIVAGTFWQSQHRRLAYAPGGSRLEVILNLLFLMMIVVLPVTTQLYGNYLESPDVTVLYSLNLALISSLDTLSWSIPVAARRDWRVMVPSAFATAVMIVATIVGVFALHAPRFIWPIAFVAPFLASYLDRRKQRRGELPL